MQAEVRSLARVLLIIVRHVQASSSVHLLAARQCLLFDLISRLPSEVECVVYARSPSADHFRRVSADDLARLDVFGDNATRRHNGVGLNRDSPEQ